jgi:AcrR family transcriptional regulator
MDIRDRLLSAAAHVYAETGYRGATTRRIAQEADVNEITLFRHFGSKDALIQEAIRRAAHIDLTPLPQEPVDPERELTDWCSARFQHLYGLRSLIRKVMGEMEEHPDIVRYAEGCPSDSGCELYRYVERLKACGLASADVNAAAATTMLMGAMFADAMSRDIMPELYRMSAEESIAEYVKVFLSAIGVSGGARDSRSAR